MKLAIRVARILVLSGVLACGTEVAPPGVGGTETTGAGDAISVDEGASTDLGTDPADNGAPADVATDEGGGDGPDIIDDNDGGTTTGDQGAPDEGNKPLDCSASPAPAGCECSDNSDCEVGYCLLTSAGKLCAEECIETCPDGFSCQAITSGGPDVIFVCVERAPLLCKPCDADGECATLGFEGQDKCVSSGSKGSFCGVHCDFDNPCPTGYECGNVTTATGAGATQCVPTDSAQCECNKLFAQLGAKTTCSQENELGTCVGSRSCTGAGLTDCDAATPAAELCNGKDDNCSGVVDDVGTLACDIVNEFGTCKGQLLCIGGTGSCQGSPPSKDVCDGTDNDCDGTTDETFADTDQDGDADCIDPDDDGDGVQDTFDNCPLVPNPDQENHDADSDGDLCDQDDDGDGVIDGLDCEPINPFVYPQAVEVCDGIDNDCDNKADEGTCKDDNDCTDDVCDPADGCVHTFNDNGCTDSNPCTTQDKCNFGQCEGALLGCDDGNKCTTDACDPVQGCKNTASSGLCDDGNLCTENDQCSGGGLHPGAAEQL